MSFYVWLFSMAEKPLIDNPVINGRWGLFHILTLVFCILTIIGLALIFKFSKNKKKVGRIIIITLASLILFFEVMMRFVRFYNYFNELKQKQGFKGANIFYEGKNFLIAIIKTKENNIYQLIIEENYLEEFEDTEFLLTAFAADGEGTWIEVETAEIF